MGSTAHDPDRMWLAHHDAEHADRCLHVRGVAVCRRCAVLYPVAVLSALVVVWADPPNAWLVAAMWLLPIPVVGEWIGEHLGSLDYSPRRQVALSAVAAPALGIAVALNALDPPSWVALAPMLCWGAVCAATAAWGWWRTVPEEAPGWEDRHEADEAARRDRLEHLLSLADARRNDQRS